MKDVHVLTVNVRQMMHLKKTVKPIAAHLAPITTSMVKVAGMAVVAVAK